MKRINEFDSALESTQTAYNSGICGLLLKSYENTIEAKNELLDICDVIWEHDYDSLIRDMKKYGINEFTISSTFSTLFKAVQALIGRGCTLQGMKNVKDRFPRWTGGEYDLHPALLMKIK